MNNIHIEDVRENFQKVYLKLRPRFEEFIRSTDGHLSVYNALVSSEHKNKPIKRGEVASLLEQKKHVFINYYVCFISVMMPSFCRDIDSPIFYLKTSLTG
ncbi:hypothetical protein DC094_14895 [Pelagibaculum spongiae]|uniref:Uncharacterized protein n=1 Tax=Pelagibaculum spongiae TaxID=2080658 RepID=A0A2V1H021_9GAMM|nr:hypothetical protein DC094_14895 [Pelagibaculum spongiae]